MIGLDTNILVRYFTHDQPAQTTLVLEVMDSLTPEKPGFISLLVLVELVWVLERFFRTTRAGGCAKPGNTHAQQRDRGRTDRNCMASTAHVSGE